MSLGVASIKGSYSGEVAFSDLQEPTSLTMRAKGSGGPGTIDTTVAVTLTGLSGRHHRVDYDADAVVGGMVGGVGQRVLAGARRRRPGDSSLAIDDVLTGARPFVGPVRPHCVRPWLENRRAGFRNAGSPPAVRHAAPGPVARR